MMNTKIIAMYLPQFHRIKENDDWWGEGFTEWTAVKGAKPLFSNHIQPRIPKDHNYYDLMNKRTMEWQASLMHEYGIDGMCFYHYWFGNGRMILEKPAENLLKWQDINMPYFFSWANDTWARSWSNIRGNSWADIYEEEGVDKSSEILLKQTYGREAEWKKHFTYLLPFFRDRRYIRIDNKPVFAFFYTEKVPCLYAMTEYWRQLAVENGFEGLYLLGFNSEHPVAGLDAAVMNSPHTFWESNKALCVNGITFPSFNKTWENTLYKETFDDEKVYFGGVGNYDDTPRRGNVWGIVYEDYSVKDLEYYLKELLLKSYVLKNELCFFNAWNEWGEGMYLEPDEEEGYARLEAVKNAKIEAERVVNLIDNSYLSKYSEMIIDKNRFLDKFLADYYRRRINKHLELLDKLLRCKENGVCITEILSENLINTVAVYGMGDVGYHLILELERLGAKVQYVIDRNKIHIKSRYKIYLPEEDLPNVDAIIVTATMDYNVIYDALKEKTNALIFSIEELFVDLI